MFDKVSPEPLDIIKANECGQTTLSAYRFRACFNEIEKLRSIVDELRTMETIERLRAALKELADAAERDMKLNQGDDADLDAVEYPGGHWSLRTENAIREARTHEQSAPAECTHVPMKNALDDGVSCIRCGTDLGQRS